MILLTSVGYILCRPDYWYYWETILYWWL